MTTSRMPARAALVALVALLSLAAVAAACSSSPRLTPTPGGSTEIVVTLTDELRIEPATLDVPAGEPVTFVITNIGVIDHEFYLGDEAAQAAHEEEMAHGGMAHDEPNGVMLSPGQTKRLTFTFEAGEWLAGCHIPGHYPGGMRATISAEQ